MTATSGNQSFASNRECHGVVDNPVAPPVRSWAAGAGALDARDIFEAVGPQEELDTTLDRGVDGLPRPGRELHNRVRIPRLLLDLLDPGGDGARGLERSGRALGLPEDLLAARGLGHHVDVRGDLPRAGFADLHLEGDDVVAVLLQVGREGELVEPAVLLRVDVLAAPRDAGDGAELAERV